ncbi:MAG: histidine phosphatase family protein [Alphaproteobacteria bacterium]|nr:histidine phosphatase family protein [Alphaproteobacteria bacterium]
MKKHFYMFRHGQTIWNAEGRPQGQHQYPVPLSVTGKEQALKLAQVLKDKKIKKIVSSDLLRARQTAEIVAQQLNVPLDFDVRLREVDYGILNGLYTIERYEVYPDFRKCYEDITQAFPEGESLAFVAHRVAEALKDIANNVQNRAIGISTHGHAITAFVEETFSYKVKRVDNCSFVHIMYSPEKDLFEAVELPPAREFGNNNYNPLY